MLKLWLKKNWKSLVPCSFWETLPWSLGFFLRFSRYFFTIKFMAVLYLLFEAFIIYVILRRLGCSSCYKCKTCTSGFGRLAGAFFGRGFVKKESVGNRSDLSAFVYFLLLVVPVAVLFFMLWQAFSFVQVSGAGLSFGSGCLQRNHLVQPFG